MDVSHPASESATSEGGRSPCTVRNVTKELPDRLYEPVLVTADGEGVFYQVGAFETEAEAQTVLEIWRSEGRTEEMAVNVVQVFRSVDEWQSSR